MSDRKPTDELGLSSEDAENLGLSEEDLERVAGGNDPGATSPEGETTIIIIRDNP
jgi:hypothetical protein